MTRRWPPKPRPGDRCDGYVDVVAPTRWGNPRVVRCRNDAVETVLPTPGNGWGDLLLCADCRDSMVARGLIHRNPRRRPRKPPGS